MVCGTMDIDAEDQNYDEDKRRAHARRQTGTGSFFVSKDSFLHDHLRREEQRTPPVNITSL
jgi:hypothetical protein